MAIYADWFARNGASSFPFSLQASLVDDRGLAMSELILADLKMRFVGAAESQLFVSYFKLTDTNISIAFSRTLPDDQTVAVLTLTRANFSASEPYELLSTAGQAIGTIVFGDLNNIDNGEWLFSGPAQTGLSRAAFDAINQPAVNRFGFIGQQTDVYPLAVTGSGDVKVSEETLLINGSERQAIVFSLVDNVALETRSVLADYAGNCGNRPESRTCPDPQPIESFAGVEADCCGRIYVEFRGCGDLYPLANHCGVVLSCETTVDDTCPAATNVPGPNGRLPSEFDDQCENSGLVVSEQDDNIRDLAETPPPTSRIDYRSFL